MGKDMKYIDADLLRKEIEFAKSVYDNPKRVVHGVADAFMQDGRAAMCDDVLKKIDSLQQEKNSTQDTELTGFESALFTAFSDAWQSYLLGEEVNVVQWVKENSAELLKAARCQQEQQEVDLEKELKKWRHEHFRGKRDDHYNGEYLERSTQLEIAHRFFELGKNSK